MNIETTQGASALIGADEDENEDDGGDVREDDTDTDDVEDDDSDDADGEEDSEHDSDTENNRLRAYELNKLRLATRHRDIFADCDLVYLSVCLGLTE
jgi:TATA-binding protein-associated factor Taf7